VISASTGLPAANGGTTSARGVSVTEGYRCGADTAMLISSSSCTTGHLSSYVTITLADTYTPPWAHFGVGSAINYRVTRQVMLQQVELD
jgi:hypothetical protein